jgi:adenine deaminase
MNRPTSPADPAPLTLEQFLRAMPKVELHCHLFGTVRKRTFEDLVRRAGAPIAAAEIESFYTRGEKPVGVLRVLRALDTLLVKSPQDLGRITLEYLEDAAAHGVLYSEFFWNPTGTARDSGIPYAQAQAAIVGAIHEAREQFGVIGRLVPAIDREADPAAALEMVGWIVEHRVDEVIGIGIDYREVDRPPEMFAAAYAAARRAGLRTTAHAGEFGMPWTNVQTAVELLKVDRIDHGYTVVDNPEFALRCAERGIVFTVVPSNSYYLRTLPRERWALDHPIRRMPGLGLRVHPNTDDPTLHHVTPTGAWLMMTRDFGFGLDDLRAFMLNGLDAAWIDAATRRRWREESTLRFDSLRARLAAPHTAGH